MGKNGKSTVVVTGFGVFRDYQSNPSWEAVNLIKLAREDVDLVKIEIPVIYDVTEKEVSRIWTDYSPTLVVHCGVSHLATCLILEKRAVQNLERYCSDDVSACKPQCSPGSTCMELKYLYTQLDLDKACQHVNDHFGDGRLPVSACVSNHAGEYLCEYIYRCSLQKNPNRTLFIHVPKESNELSIKDIARGLEVTIEAILEQLL